MGIGLGVVVLSATAGRSSDGPSFQTVIFVVLLLVAIALIKNGLEQRKLDRVQKAFDRAHDVVEEHLETLARRRLALVRKDPYGILIDAGWQKEWSHFLEKVILPRLSPGEREIIVNFRSVHPDGGTNALERAIVLRAQALTNETHLFEGTCPIEFEQWCATVLRKNGWKTSTTKGSGDQGCDVLAVKDRKRLVLQCKLYTRPIGNKAVQEAFAAKAHYKTDAAAVVTNANFTPSARDLAATTGVLLLHQSDLSRLDELAAELA